MTRYGIDAPTALQLAREGVVPAHQLVAPSGVRSQAMSLLFAEVRLGKTTEAEARAILDRLTSLRIRVLGDRVSRATAWRIATQQGWEDSADAEYIAVTQLQADALVALDPALAQRAQGLVPLAGYEALTG